MNSKRKTILSALTLFSALTLLGCGSNNDLSDGPLPDPRFIVGAPLVSCAAATGGAATPVLTPLDVSIVIGLPGVGDPNRALVDIPGTIPMGQEAYLVISPTGLTCQTTAGQLMEVDGRIEGFVSINEANDFRLTVIIVDEGSRVECDSDRDCMLIEDGSLLAISDSIDVSLG
ncbi:MAG: hypothetical protein AAF533_22645 [Acidobacteriota bacterium]